MRLDRMAIGDVVVAKVKGRSIYVEVLEIIDARSTSARSVPALAGGTPALGRSLRTGARPACRLETLGYEVYDDAPARSTGWHTAYRLKGTGAMRVTALSLARDDVTTCA